jgi:hypothetical protein
VKPMRCYPIDRLRKVRVTSKRVVYLEWLQLIASGEAGFEHAAW